MQTVQTFAMYFQYIFYMLINTSNPENFERPMKIVSSHWADYDRNSLTTVPKIDQYHLSKQ